MWGGLPPSSMKYSEIFWGFWDQGILWPIEAEGSQWLNIPAATQAVAYADSLCAPQRLQNMSTAVAEPWRSCLVAEYESGCYGTARAEWPIPGACNKETNMKQVPGACPAVGEFRKLALMAEADGHLRQKLQQVLKLSKEKWDDARDHAMRAVVADNRMRIWYADKTNMELGLLFTCRLGNVDLDRPVGLLQKKSQDGTQTTMEATLMAQQTPSQREQASHPSLAPPSLLSRSQWSCFAMHCACLRCMLAGCRLLCCCSRAACGVLASAVLQQGSVRP